MNMIEALSPVQVDALRQTTLHLGWVTHGLSGSLPVFGVHHRNGPSIMGVNDDDYRVALHTLDGLGAGDISVRESEGGEPVAPSRRTLLDMNSPFRRSPFVPKPTPLERHEHWRTNINNFDRGVMPDDRLHELPGIPQAIIESAELIRNLQIDTPFVYMDAYAIARGLTRAIADSPRRTWTEDNLEIRDRDMVRGLGDIAVSLIENRAIDDARPKMSFVAGSGHRKGVETLLKSYGIRFENEVSKDTLRQKLHMFHSKWLAPFDEMQKRRSDYCVNNWYRNLRKHGFEPVTTERSDFYDPYSD